MADLLSISINLSKLDKNRFTTDKNGNKWLNLSGWLNDQQDEYGNYGFVTHTPTKAERDAKERLQILGNFKKPIKQMTQPIQKKEIPINNNDDDDLPF